MLHTEALGLLIGAVALGAVHGIEPGHGWPVAASYALDRSNKWVYGLAASLILGVGHLVSSIAMVGAFYYVKAAFDLARVNEPIAVAVGVRIGGPVSLAAGVMLIGLGVREYRYGHSHGRALRGGSVDRTDHGRHGHEHGHDDHHDHAHADGHGRHYHDGSRGGLLARVRRAVPFLGGEGDGHTHRRLDGAPDRGLLGLAGFAFLLGFAHEEEFEIIGLCAGSMYCLELMGAYAITVVVGIVGLTMALIAGYERFEERVERYAPYLPAFSAAVLIVMGLGLVTGLL